MPEAESLFGLEKGETQKLSKPSKSNLQIPDTYTEELIFGLCGPIGSPIHLVTDAFRKILTNDYNYNCEVIRISDFIQKIIGEKSYSSEYEKLSTLINSGDQIRKENHASFFAELSIEKISQSRTEDLDESEKKKVKEKTGEQIHYKSRRKCFIIDSIKNQHELDVLKEVYRELFYFVGVFSSKSNREKELKEKGLKPQEAQELIEKDSGDNIDPDYSTYGQTVRKTFPLADLFIRIDSKIEEHLNFKIERFLHLIFNTKIITPTKAETSMYLAAAAAGNSACLSRQVGACLTDSEGNVLSVGWNDVPQAGGHLYHFSESDKLGERDHRCGNEGKKCHNEIEKEKLTTEIAEKMISEELVRGEDKEKIITLLRNTRLQSIIEFSRAIHAEMYTLISSALNNNGIKIKGGSIYSTTYPCHNCARHLIAAGVMNIFYIEPYPKSLAIQLHGDSITEDDKDEKRVRILAFDGISPNKYLQFFTYKQENRKKQKEDMERKTAKMPKFEVTLESLPILEGIIVNRLKEGKSDEKK